MLTTDADLLSTKPAGLWVCQSAHTGISPLSTLTECRYYRLKKTKISSGLGVRDGFAGKVEWTDCTSSEATRAVPLIHSARDSFESFNLMSLSVVFFSPDSLVKII